MTSWFMRDAKVGEPAAKMLAATYIMLLQKTPQDAKDLTKNKAANPKAASPKKAAKTKKKEPESKSKPSDTPNTNPADGGKTHGFSPRLHIDVQVHISPESSPEQIDKIFESMAKHLKDFKS
ncbi:hypothetical protein [Bowmanella yangjiangensis]|uniref:Uncharacterized protein n=1 Tax=Bowmanella yangjiangensis TaxID=2811230 RepID=A0ABS3CY86_9ALTE|nr:hypothetical protein [Bowmanella yangjiangensis]MBN7821290.1 hypothetical protein [Bowmanella yangjiangensis]